MKIQSVRFGEIDVGANAVIHFPAGIAPFGKKLDFVVLAGGEKHPNSLVSLPYQGMEENPQAYVGCRLEKDESEMLGGQELAWLQSLQFPQLGFWVGHAGKLFPDRDIGIEAHHLQSVHIERMEQLCIVLILTIEAKQVTANLLAPVLVNTEAGIGRQVVVAAGVEQVRVPVPACRVTLQAI